MSISLNGIYLRSEYEKDLETAIDTQLGNVSADITTINTAVSTLSGNITTLSSNITNILDFATVAEDDTANFTLDLTSVTNFDITNDNTANKTLIITNLSTATDTMTDITLKLTFTATAAITYTGTITWSIATAPNPTAAGTFLITMKSFDQGVNWFASYTGLY